MILDIYRNEIKKTDKEKQIEMHFEQHCLANGLYDHITDKELNAYFKETKND